MRQWKGKKSKDSYDEIKTGRPCKLPLLEQLFMTLAWLGFTQDCQSWALANRFDVSKSSVSRITNTWINLMYHSLKAIK